MGDKSVESRVKYESVDELFKNATPCNVVEDVARRIEIASLKGIYSRDYIINVLGYTAEEIDPIEASEPEDRRRAEAWNALADLVVGQEHLGPLRFP